MTHLELFDDAGVDLRPQIREARDERKRRYLLDHPIWMLTIREYAEIKVCGCLLKELSDEQIIELSQGTPQQQGNGILRWIEGDLQTHRDNLRWHIEDTVEMYAENNGMYSDTGKLIHRRMVDDAIRLGLPVPERVRSEYED